MFAAFALKPLMTPKVISKKATYKAPTVTITLSRSRKTVLLPSTKPMRLWAISYVLKIMGYFKSVLKKFICLALKFWAV